MRKKSSQPTEGELEILQVLWDHGPATVREVHDHLSQHRSTGYTTVLKLMQIMAEKKLVTRDESQRTHVYRARLRKQQTQKKLVTDLIQRAFDGSANQLVMRALESRNVSSEEIGELRQLLDQLEEDAS